MAKNKLKKFAEYDSFSNTFDAKNIDLKGFWDKNIFDSSHKPLVLDLACGRGEYTVGLGLLHSEKNFIGIDIKGSRMWKGAKFALENSLNNIAFLRTQIELLDKFFGPEEVSEIWITFPDPQPQLGRAKKRLTSPRFLNLYRGFCKKGTLIYLKTDSDLLYDYTKEIISTQSLTLVSDIPNVYEMAEIPNYLQIKTYYENMWLKEGRTIKFLVFSLF